MLPDADVETRMHDYTKSISLRQRQGSRRIVGKSWSELRVGEEVQISGIVVSISQFSRPFLWHSTCAQRLFWRVPPTQEKSVKAGVWSIYLPVTPPTTRTDTTNDSSAAAESRSVYQIYSIYPIYLSNLKYQSLARHPFPRHLDKQQAKSNKRLCFLFPVAEDVLPHTGTRFTVHTPSDPHHRVFFSFSSPV